MSAEKLSKLIAAAGIRPTDNVLEVGAGIGTVARKLPQSRSLTVVELERLIEFLRGNVPHAKVLQGDALEIIQNLSFDVLISNLPNTVTESLIGLMPGMSFRTAILAVGDSTDLDQLSRIFSWSEVTRISGDDFLPPQPSVSCIVKVVPKTGLAGARLRLSVLPDFYQVSAYLLAIRCARGLRVGRAVGRLRRLLPYPAVDTFPVADRRVRSDGRTHRSGEPTVPGR
jgi:hypothetical protein